MYPFHGGKFPNYTYARRDENKRLIILCHCACHELDENRYRPDAAGNKLCQPCEDEAYLPWTDILASFPT